MTPNPFNKADGLNDRLAAINAPQNLSLTELAQLDRELTREQIKHVLRQLSVLVVAHHEPVMGRTIPRLIAKGLVKPESMVRLKEGDMTSRFAAMPKVEEGILPVIVCSNGREFEEAARLTCDHKTQDGLYVSSYFLGNGPTSSQVFDRLGGELPSSTTRVLVTGGSPKNHKTDLERGIFDTVISIPKESDAFCAKVAQAFLKRRFRGLTS